jgi:hypothetical protein
VAFAKLATSYIAELLQGKEAQYPRYAPTATFKRAGRQQKGVEAQQSLL